MNGLSELDQTSLNLAIEDVCVTLAEAQIVRDVSLDVPAGAVVGVVGPNGSGKSTLLRSIYRLLKPASGRIMLNEDDVWKLSARETARRMAVVVQETASEFDFTVSEVVLMGRTPFKRAFERDTLSDVELVEAALDRVGMKAFGGRDFSTLSGGEKQRVLVARALAQEPRVLVLDEPINHLDIHYQLDILALLGTIDTTTLITLHDLNLAMEFCDHLYVLYDGEIVTAGAPNAVFTEDILRDVFKVSAHLLQHPGSGKSHLCFEPARHEGPSRIEA